MGITEDALGTPACGATGEVIRVIKSVCFQRVEHIADRNRFILSVFLFSLLKTSNCYPLDFQKSPF